MPQQSPTPAITLRHVTEHDLPLFFAQQLDPEANHMAAFTAKDPSDRDTFMAHWHKILRDKTITIRTILYEHQIVGYILSHRWCFAEPEISYWIGKAWWGKGIATAALTAFLRLQPERPLYARVAKDNIASRRVLEKCGFHVIGHDKGFAHARGKQVEEIILQRVETSSRTNYPSAPPQI